jgi:hypothetical protein
LRLSLERDQALPLPMKSVNQRKEEPEAYYWSDKPWPHRFWLEVLLLFRMPSELEPPQKSLSHFDNSLYAALDVHVPRHCIVSINLYKIEDMGTSFGDRVVVLQESWRLQSPRYTVFAGQAHEPLCDMRFHP